MGAVLLALSGAFAVYALFLSPAFGGRRRRALRDLQPPARAEGKGAGGDLAKQLRSFPLTRDLGTGGFRLLQLAAGLLFWEVTAAVLVLEGFTVHHARLFPWTFALGWLLPYALLRVALKRRREAMRRDYVSLLGHMVLVLRAGGSVLEAFRTSLGVVQGPLRPELAEFVADARLAPLPSALRRLAARTSDPDIEFFAQNVAHQQAVGMSLADALGAEEAHSRALLRQAVRERIRSLTVTMSAITGLLLLNGTVALIAPIALRALEEWAGTIPS